MTDDLPIMVWEASIRTALNPAMTPTERGKHMTLQRVSGTPNGQKALRTAVEEYRSKIDLLSEYLKAEQADGFSGAADAKPDY